MTRKSSEKKNTSGPPPARSRTAPGADPSRSRTLQVKLFSVAAALALIGIVSLVEFSIRQHRIQMLDAVAQHGIKQVMEQPAPDRLSLLSADEDVFRQFARHLLENSNIVFARMESEGADGAWLVTRQTPFPDSNDESSTQTQQNAPGPRVVRRKGPRVLEIAIPLNQLSVITRPRADASKTQNARSRTLWVGLDATQAFASSTAAAQQTRQAQAIVAGVVLLGLWIVTRRALRPVEMLVEDAERIARGQEPVAAIDASRSGETRRLQHAIGAIADQFIRPDFRSSHSRSASVDRAASANHRAAPIGSTRGYSALGPTAPSSQDAPRKTRALALDAGCKILLVEDNPVNQTVAIKMLEELGCSVECARDGVEGIAKFDSDQFDIVFMDIQMPKMDGLESTRKIRAIEAEFNADPTPIIALTAHSQPRDRTACRVAGMNGHIGKPFTKNDLEQALLEWSRGPKSPAIVDRVTQSDPKTVGAERSKANTASDDVEEPVIDTKVFWETMSACGDDESFRRELVDAFVSRTSSLGATCDRAISQGDRNCVETTAHEIKSSSGQIGAKRLQSLARQLEVLAAEDGANMAPLGEKLSREIELACEALLEIEAASEETADMARVLIVEDDRITSAILSRAIERAGHQTQVAHNGKQALERLDSDEVSILITDLMMPELNGQQLCEQVRSQARYEALPILVTTGAMDESRVAWVEALPHAEIVSKPVCLSDLIDRIHRLTGEPAK